MNNLPYISAPNEISNEEYHRGEKYAKFVSSSTIKQLLISPLWLRYCQLHPDDTRTISLEYELKGSVYHDLLCSFVNTGSFDSFYQSWAVFSPPVNERTGKPFGYDTNAFTGAYEAFKAENQGKEICSQAEIDLSMAMIDHMLHGNPHLSKDVRFLIEHGRAEQSHFCQYQGAYFKFRTDLKTNSKIIDWKTCGHEVPKVENWSRQVVKMGYHISAAFYQFFDHLITGRWRPFYWIAQEKEPPYDFNIIDASNWAYEIINEPDGTQTVIPHSGAIIANQLIETYIMCLEKDEWPGYSVFTQPDFRGHRISSAPVPGYEEGKQINFYL